MTDDHAAPSAKVPSKAEAKNLMRGLGIPKHIMVHTSAVAKYAVGLARKLYEVSVDLRVVEIGGILHDIGRCKTHDLSHAMVGGEILRNLGFDPRLARVAETHLLGGITKREAIQAGLPERFHADYLPTTLEEKLVCLADKHFAGRHKVSLEQRFAKWFAKWGRTDLLLAAYERVKELDEEIAGYLV
ncbi:MAG: TIGR00295 family protein [Promethearchaeota archaeon]